MQKPRSLRAAARRLRLWRFASMGYGVAAGVLFGLGRYVEELTWALLILVLPLALLVVHWAGVRLPPWIRWFASNWARTRGGAPRRRAQLERARIVPPSQGFEVDLPCERCDAPNIGEAAGEWDGGQVFRCCDTCGHTQWWGPATPPPRIGRRLRPVEDQRPRTACPRCAYDLRGVPLRSEDRGTGRVTHVQQCPECGRAEIVVLRGTPQRKPQLAR